MSKKVVLGALNASYLEEILQDITRKLHLTTKRIMFIFYTEKNDMEEMRKIVTQEAFTEIEKLLARGAQSFFLKRDHESYVFIRIRKEWYKKREALAGQIIHEVIHADQAQRKNYLHINASYEYAYRKYRKKFFALPYAKKDIEKLLNSLEPISKLLLKDLYANTEAVKKKLGKYLAQYYQKELKMKKTCPRPVFYKKFKRTAQRSMGVIAIAFEFEFALLSMTLPLMRYEGRMAQDLFNDIEECFEINIPDLARKCREIVSLYIEEFNGTEKFQRRFFAAILEKVYDLLQ